MATLMTTTRLWESGESAESIVNRYKNPVRPKTPWKWKPPGKDKSTSLPHEPKDSLKTSSKSVKRTSSLAVPKSKVQDTSGKLVTCTNGVKRTALLYEITERTNRLAKPRMIPDPSRVGQPSRASLPMTRKVNLRLSERVSELSRPKITYNPPTKPAGYIAPGALRAVATQRILELATPRKTRSQRPRKKNLAPVHAPCSSRISYLARPKHSVDRGKGKHKSFLRRSLHTQISLPTWEFPSTRVWRELGYSGKVLKSCEREHKLSKLKGRGNKSRRTTVKSMKPSQSDQSVFSLTGIHQNTSKPHGRKARNFRRAKTSRIKKRSKFRRIR